MDKSRTSASKAFALELVQAVLSTPSSIPSQYMLTGLWMHMDMEVGRETNKLVSIFITIAGAPSDVIAECDITSEGGAWVRGTCKIELTSDPSRHWKFDCRVEDGRVVATPLPAPAASS